MSTFGGWSQPVDATVYLKGEMECASMGQRFHRGFTAAEKTELWDRWKRGESLKAIGRAFGKPSSSIYFLVVDWRSNDERSQANSSSPVTSPTFFRTQLRRRHVCTFGNSLSHFFDGSRRFGRLGARKSHAQEPAHAVGSAAIAYRVAELR